MARRDILKACWKNVFVYLMTFMIGVWVYIYQGFNIFVILVIPYAGYHLILIMLDIVFNDLQTIDGTIINVNDNRVRGGIVSTTVTISDRTGETRKISFNTLTTLWNFSRGKVSITYMRRSKYIATGTGIKPRDSGIKLLIFIIGITFLLFFITIFVLKTI